MHNIDADFFYFFWRLVGESSGKQEVRDAWQSVVQLPDVGSCFSRVSSLFVPLFTVSFMLFDASTMEFE